MIIGNKLIIPNLEIFIMNPCNPYCKDCKDLNSSRSQNFDFDIECLVQDVDDFLGNVDRVHRFIVTGSETFLCRDLNKLLSHLIRQDKIDLINIFTKGFIIPDSNILALLKNGKMLVTISNYPVNDSKNRSQLLAALEENHINYLIKDTWRDLGRYNPVASDRETDLKNRFKQCISKNFHILSNGEYHICLRSSHGKQLDQFSPDDSEDIIFRGRKDPRLFKKELRKLLQKKYITACSKCRGSYREMAIKDHLKKLSGNWYNENIYYKYRIHKMSLRMQYFARLILLPASMLLRFINSSLNRFEQPHVEMPITTRCNFHCRDCSNLITFFKHPVDFDLEMLVRDIDDFLSHVDRVHRFIVMGGETFLYRDLHKLLNYMIIQRKIDLIHLFTNGSIIPEPDITQLLKHRKLLVSISSFPVEVSPNKPRFVAEMEKNHINYIVEDKMWKDMGGFNPIVDNSIEAVKNRFAQCYSRGCHNLSNGEYHVCPRSVHGQALGQFTPDNSDKVIIRGRKDHQTVRKELLTLRQKEYINACRKCTGTLEEDIIPGIQLNKINLVN